MALNNCIFMGRIVRDPEIKQTSNGKTVLSFTIAINRDSKKANFIPCVAWENTAKFINNFFKKGNMIAVSGEMQSRNYESKGIKHYAMECLVKEASFTGESAGGKSAPEEYTIISEDDYSAIE